MLLVQEVSNGREDRGQFKKKQKNSGDIQCPTNNSTATDDLTPENVHVVWPKIRLMLII